MKKVILLLMIVIMFGYISFSAIAKEEHSGEYSQQMLEVAEKVLLDLGLWQEFNSDEVYLTRAEAAIIACKILNTTFEYYYVPKTMSYEDVQIELYKDVPTSHWASDWINTASYHSFYNGILYSPFKGDGNGYFYPDKNITYQEFVKVLVVSLGWGIYAEYSSDIPNTYPEAYLKIADGLGIYRLSEEKYEQPLQKNDAIFMIYTSLKAPGFELKGYGHVFGVVDWLENRDIVQVSGYAEKIADDIIIVDGIRLHKKDDKSEIMREPVLCFYNKKDCSVIGYYPISSLKFDEYKEAEEKYKNLKWWTWLK